MTRRLLLFAIIAAALIWLASPFQAGGTAAPYVFQTDMYGADHVPPVDTVAWGFVRFFFNEDRTEAEYTVDVKGLSGSLVLGADMHRGPPGSNGPVVRHLADGGFLTTSGKLKLSPDELNEFASGAYYVTLSSTNNPKGEMRGQVIVPADFLPQAPPPVLVPPDAAVPPAPPQVIAPSQPEQATDAGPAIRPPNTGDAGLLAGESKGPGAAAAPFAALAVLMAASVPAAIWTRRLAAQAASTPRSR